MTVVRPIALTREVSPTIIRCELTHLARTPIDVARAREQHAAYEALLTRLGYDVRRVLALPDHPDAVFIEDTAVVLPALAVITRPGAESRREEVEAVAEALAAHRALARITAPGTLDGGDVLCTGRTLFVGRTARTNDAGIAQLAAFAAPHGFTVRAVDVTGCLHLKTAVTEVADGTLLVNPAWIPAGTFDGFTVIPVDPGEPMGANAVRAGGALIYGDAYPRTKARLEAAGLTVHTVDASEVAKAEGAVTCCSVLVD